MTFCNSDDYFGKDLLQAYADAIEACQSDLVFADVVTAADGCCRNGGTPPLHDKDAYFRSLFQGKGLSAAVWDKCYKMEIIKRYGIAFQEQCDFWEDWRFNVEYVHRCQRLSKVQESFTDAYYHYVSTPNSLSNKKTDLSKAFSACKNVKGIEDFLQTVGRLSDFKECLNGAKLKAKDYCLQVGSCEALRLYWQYLPEVDSMPLVWRLTKGHT